MQENGELDGWQTNSSPSPDSSDTDSIPASVHPSTHPQNITKEDSNSDCSAPPDPGSKIQLPNGYTQNFHETISNNSLHSYMPPRHLNHLQQHRLSQPTATAAYPPPGLVPDISNASRTAKANPGLLVNKALMDNSNPNHSFFSTVSGLRNPAAPQPPRSAASSAGKSCLGRCPF